MSDKPAVSDDTFDREMLLSTNTQLRDVNEKLRRALKRVNAIVEEVLLLDGGHTAQLASRIQRVIEEEMKREPPAGEVP